MAKERDEESWVLYFGSSGGGTASATEFISDTFQTGARMRQSASRLSSDGTIPKYIEESEYGGVGRLAVCAYPSTRAALP